MTSGINNVGSLCEDPETKGFDLEAGQSWIYPTNYPVRDYQYNIIEQALHKNTLVSLPTGLGKTFIAAVVMYNFFRWYPHGKIIFMAPTRPLVEQQIDACYRIMAIPQEATAELTGAKKSQASRVEVWQNKRVFFITPHVLQNDLETVIELGEKIKCLVFDEAHRAKGNYSYCEVIRKLAKKTKLFRVLALSATPGNSVKDVAEVMQNLLIAHLEFRNEESPDVKPYVFERSLETVVVPLGTKLQQIKEDYEKILEKYVRILIKYKIITTGVSNLTKGKIFMVLQDFKNKRNGYPNYAEITKTLNVCVTLYHAYEALVRCGLRVFLTFYEEHINNPLLHRNGDILSIMEEVREYLGPAPNVEVLPDGSCPGIPASTRFGHPKFYQLRDILLAHFSDCDNSSRVIVFFEYRESVKEAYAILSQSRPKIKPRIFVGQGVGQRQKDQIYTVKAFREGTCNTLLSTCIGEEGLDVGEVNLIVCFDITNKSPIRMIQRMGRTGRKKEGRIIVLVTEGKEQQTLKDCLVYKSNLGSYMTNSQQLNDVKYRENPIMIPSYIHPKCQKMFITVKEPVLDKKNRSLKTMLRGLSSNGPKLIEDFEIVELQEKLNYKTDLYCTKVNPLDFNYEGPKVDFSKHLEKQRTFQAFGQIKPSKQTEIFVTLLQFADSKRYNIPVTQTNSKFSNYNEGKNLVQRDIRNMFSKATESDTNLPLSQLLSFEKEKDIAHFPEELFQEISNFLSIQKSLGPHCKICENLFECPKFYYKTETINLSSWVQPDSSVFESLTAKDFELFADSLAPKSDNLCEELEADDDVFDHIQFTQFETSGESDEKSTKVNEKSFAYQTPKGFEKILNSYRLCDDDFEEKPAKIDEKSWVLQTPTTSKRQEKCMSNSDKEKVLEFFHLSSVGDLFMDESADLDKTIVYTPEIIQQSPSRTPKPKRSPSKTPDIFDESPDLFASPPSSKRQKIEDPATPNSGKGDTPIIEDSESPIICTLEKVQRLKAKKKLFTQTSQDLADKPNLAILKTPHRSFVEPRNKTSPKKIPLDTHPSNLDISDICDLSEFGLDAVTPSENKEEQVVKVSDVEISDVCDLSIFGLTETQIVAGKSSHTLKPEDVQETQTKPVKKDLDITDICDMSIFFDQPVLEKSDSGKNEDSSRKSQTKTEDKALDVGDFCDLSFFLSPEKTISKKNEDTVKTRVIDLTDSDFETSPVKTKPTQSTSKLSQLSITQMMSLVAKSDEGGPSKSNSQKENTDIPKKATQKNILSLKNKGKGILQSQQHSESPKASQKAQKKRAVAHNKNKFSFSPASNSDDDFETTVSPIFAKPKLATKKNKVKKPVPSNQKKRKKLFCEYLDDEAVLSQDERVAVSEDEDSGEDCFDASFVNDETQDVLNDTMMHAQYLKTTKSPRVRGKFKIPERPRHNITNVFSQEVDNADDTYLNDSFVVNTQDVDSPRTHELSHLEIMEMKLKKMKKLEKNKKRKSDDKLDSKDPKRRRVLRISDDDSD